jgi:hypothetical protein
MTMILVCFNLGAPAAEQVRQISFWLDYFNSSLALPPIVAGTVLKWNIILIGVRSDEQNDFSLTQNSNIIVSWKKKWNKLPIASKIFSVSSLKSIESVQSLLQFIGNSCNHIMDTHAVQIPSTYHQFLSKLHNLAKEHPLVHWSFLHKKLGNTKQDESAFKAMLHYCQSLGRIVWLPTGYVFTDPTLAPQIAAKFVSPIEVRLALLKQQTEKVEILNSTDVGCLLDIDVTDNERYGKHNHTIHILTFFVFRLQQELQLMVHLRICFTLHTADSDVLLYLFPSLSTKASMKI